MVQRQEIEVRRAKVGDVDDVVAFVNRAQRRQSELDRRTVLARLGGVGFLLAERDGELIGMLGWQAENLVVRVTDFLIWPAREREAVSRLLLSKMEREAVELQCEAALLFLPHPSPLELVEFYEMFGYEPRTLTSLPKAWGAAAREGGFKDEETVLVKRLRFDRVARPL